MATVGNNVGLITDEVPRDVKFGVAEENNHSYR
jgi:hypothetical protein